MEREETLVSLAGCNPVAFGHVVRFHRAPPTTQHEDEEHDQETSAPQKGTQERRGVSIKVMQGAFNSQEAGSIPVRPTAKSGNLDL